MTSHFFAGKHSAQNQPFASARTSIAAHARTHACLHRENSRIKHTFLAKSILSNLGELQESYWQLILNDSVCSHFEFATLVFFSWSSLCLCAQASLFFSTGGSRAAKYCDVLQKGKEHLLQPVKP